MSVDDNDDWLATAEIYADALLPLLEFTLDIAVNLSDLVGLRPAVPNALLINHHHDAIEYCILEDAAGIDRPTARVVFEYDADHVPVSVRVTFAHCPWIEGVSKPWLDWLNKECDTQLQETGISFAVCNFVEHQALDFFGLVEKGMDYTILWMDGCSWDTSKTTLVSGLSTSKPIHHYSTRTPTDAQALSYKAIVKHWRDWLEYTCPICFVPEKARDAVRLPCQCLFCPECLQQYVASVISELNLHRDNPFKCPTCRVDVRVLEPPCADLLTDSQRDAIVVWRKQLDTPECHLLTVCPRPKCRSESMYYVNKKSDPTLVFCDDCGSTFCALCMVNYSQNKDAGSRKSSNPTHHECNQSRILQLCRRYINAKPEIQRRCEERWHWIESYSRARLDYHEQQSVDEWIGRVNGQRCPTCRAAIERTDGCFHMHCVSCGTHFCYECGDEIFPPFYGTHKCWEDEDDDWAAMGFFELFMVV